MNTDNIGQPNDELLRNLESGRNLVTLADFDLAVGRFTDPPTPDDAVMLVRLYAARQVLHTRSSLYTNKDLQTLAYLGRVDEALRHARLRRRANDQMEGLTAICKAGHTTASQAAALLAEIEANAWWLPDNDSHDLVLKPVILLLIQVGQFESAVKLAQTLKRRRYNAEFLCNLVATLTTTVGQIDQALAVVQSIDPDQANFRALALVSLVAAFAQTGDVRRDEIISEVLRRAREIKDENYRVEVMGQLALVLSQSPETEKQADDIFSEALSVANQDVYPFSRVRALGKLAAIMLQAGDRRGAETLAAALDSVERIENNTSYLHAQDYQTDAQRDVVKVLQRARQFAQAWAVIHAIRVYELNVYDLCDLAGLWPEQSLAIFTDAIEAAHTMGESDVRNRCQQHLSTALAKANDPRRDRIFAETLALLDSMKDSSDKAYLQSQMAVAVAETGPVERAVSIARSIEDRKYKSEALCDISWMLASTANSHVSRAQEVFSEMLTVIQAVPEDVLEPHTRWKLATSLASNGQVDHALSMARAFTDPTSRAGEMLNIAHSLPPTDHERQREILTEALGHAQTITFDRDRAIKLGWIAAFLSELGDSRSEAILMDALAVVRTIHDGESRSIAFNEIVTAFTQTE